jgi:hypothetical protein
VRCEEEEHAHAQRRSGVRRKNMHTPSEGPVDEPKLEMR